MQENDPLFVKIIIVGDSGVGKTSLLNRYCYSKFDSVVAPTIGTDFSTKIIKKNQNTLRLQLWDIAGQERFKAVSKMYMRGCLGCILVADATQENSLTCLLEWKRIVMENCDLLGEDYDLPFIVLENKMDLIKTHSESQEIYVDALKEKEAKLEQFALKHKIIKGFLTSAKENLNLNEAFLFLSDKILDQLEIKCKKNKDTNFRSLHHEIKLTAAPVLWNQKEKKCC